MFISVSQKANDSLDNATSWLIHISKTVADDC